MLTVYLVLLVGVPSTVTIAGLGAYGRPSFLWGLLLAGWWLVSRVQGRDIDVVPVAQPIRHAFGALLAVALVSFAMAMFRGQPADQVSPALSALARLASWGGVLLVTIDGVTTIGDVSRLARRLAIAGGILAALGLLQTLTRQTLLDWFGLVPGLNYSSEGIGERGEFARATATAIHPLEFAVSIIGVLPIALAAAVTGGFRPDREDGRRLRWWLPFVLIMIAAIVAVSRSGILGLAVSVLLSIPLLPRRLRWTVVGLCVMVSVPIVVLVPRMLTTMIYLFVGSDSSTESRTNALARLPEFLAGSPLFGVGFGTFLPRYYIFDNQFALLVVELGVVGIVAFAVIVATALWSTLHAGLVSRQPNTVRLSRMFAASLASVVVLYAFFDALTFPIAAGLFFLILGLCGSMRTIGHSDAATLTATLGSAQSAGSPLFGDDELTAGSLNPQSCVERDQVGPKSVEGVAPQHGF
jgi:hypothetical protein